MSPLKKRLIALMIGLMLLTAVACALAEELPETLTGYFANPVYIREKPESSPTSLAMIPADSPVVLAPVDERYAAVTYNGVSGYVFYRDLKPIPEDTPLEPFDVYLESGKYLYDTPLGRANVLITVQAETPMTVLASVNTYYRVRVGELEGYVYRADCTVLTEFPSRPTSAEFYVTGQESLRGYPLLNAEAVATLEPGRIYQATATSRGFYQVTADGVTGWLPTRSAFTFKEDASTTRVALMHDGVTLYARPDKGFPAEDAYRGGERLMFISAENNGFYRLDEEELYVWRDDVETFAVSRVATQQLVVGLDTPLTLRPTGAQEADVTLAAGELYTAQYATKDMYLVYADDVWGFLPKASASVSSLTANEAMNRTAALVTASAVLYGEDGRRTALREGDKLFILAMGDDFYRCSFGGETGYVFRQAVEIVSADVPLTAYTIAAPADVQLMDFPDKATAEIEATIPAGAAVEVTGFNRCYLLVSWNGHTGYTAQDGLITAESEGIPTTEDVPSYQVALDKSTFMAYVFLLDDEGNPCAVVMSAKVGIGKRSTPTPSGTFTLGVKERWHTFTYSYTPHTTTYVKARFIHGIPCRTRSESTKIGYMERSGMITGGCLRSPMEFARFVYMNCPSYQTELVVVNGGLEVPERTITPEELFAAADEAATPTDLPEIATPADLPEIASPSDL